MKQRYFQQMKPTERHNVRDSLQCKFHLHAVQRTHCNIKKPRRVTAAIYYRLNNNLVDSPALSNIMVWSFFIS